MEVNKLDFDLKKLSRPDQAIIGGAGLVFISGFLPWWGYSGPLALYGGSIDGWSAGFTAWAGTLLLTLAGVYLFLRRAEVQLPTLPVGPSVLVAGLSALGLLLVVLRWLTLPSVLSGLAGSIGARSGILPPLLAAIIAPSSTARRYRASSEPVP